MAKTWLKVLKDNCSRLRKSLSLEAFACLEFWLLGHDGLLLLSSHSSFAFIYCVQVSSFPLFRWCHLRLSVGGLGFWWLDSVLEPIVGIELLKEVFTSRSRWMPLIIEWNASANMFYLLKQLLLLNLIIFILKCNNLIFNEIVVLNVSFVCLLYSLFIEDYPIYILVDGPLISEVLLSQSNEPIIKWYTFWSTNFSPMSRSRCPFVPMGV
jgi:hypothetical protein